VKAAQGILANLSVEATQGGGRGLRIGEQWPGRMGLAMSIAQSRQRLHAGDTAGGGVDKGLEDGEGLSVDHLGRP